MFVFAVVRVSAVRAAWARGRVHRAAVRAIRAPVAGAPNAASADRPTIGPHAVPKVLADIARPLHRPRASSSAATPRTYVVTAWHEAFQPSRPTAYSAIPPGGARVSASAASPPAPTAVTSGTVRARPRPTDVAITTPTTPANRQAAHSALTIAADRPTRSVPTPAAMAHSAFMATERTPTAVVSSSPVRRCGAGPGAAAGSSVAAGAGRCRTIGNAPNPTAASTPTVAPRPPPSTGTSTYNAVPDSATASSARPDVRAGSAVPAIAAVATVSAIPLPAPPTIAPATASHVLPVSAASVKPPTIRSSPARAGRSRPARPAARVMPAPASAEARSTAVPIVPAAVPDSPRPVRTASRKIGSRLAIR